MFIFIFIILLALIFCGVIEFLESRMREERKRRMVEDVKAELFERGHERVEVQACKEIGRSVADRIKGQRNYEIFVTADKKSYVVKANDKGKIYEIRGR